MSDFLKLAKSRKSSYEFADKPVSDKNVQLILEAGRWAPSAHNAQNWSFIVVKNKDLIRKLMSLCYYGYFHELPNAIVAVVMEPIFNDKKVLLNDKWKSLSSYHKYLNVSLPALNMCYEAESLGIDSFIASLSSIEAANKLLKVPASSSALLLVCLGYTKKNAFSRERSRKDLASITFYERYGGKSE